jgi:hypothetical protein
MNLTPRTTKRRLAAAGAAASVAVVVPLALVASGSGAVAAESSPFSAGDLVVYRVGDGSSALSGAAAPVFLDEYTTGGTKVQSVPLPVTSDGAQHRLTASGTSSSEGALTRSADGRFLVATGYDAAPGTTGPNGTSLTASAASAVSRVVARVDGNASIDSTTALTDATAPSIIRTAVTSTGSDYRVAGSGGPISSVANGGTLGTVIDAAGTAPFASEGLNVYDLGIAGGQLYASGANGVLVSAVGTGVPAGPASATALSGLPAHALAGSFALLDLSAAVPGPDTLYYVDEADRAGAIEKYTSNGATWTAKGSVPLDGATGLAAIASGDLVHLYATSANHLSALDDASASTSVLEGLATTIATAAANEAFRGVALAPTKPAGPSAVITSPAANTHVAGGAATLAVAAHVIAPAGVHAVTFAVDGGPAVAATDAGSGRWTASVPLVGLSAPGAHQLVVTATDLASHTGSDARTFVLDSATVPRGVVKPGVVSLIGFKHPGFSVVKYKGAPKGKGLRAKNGKGTVALRFYGTGVDIHLGVAKASGKVQVFLDGKKVAVIDLNGAKTKDLVKKLRHLKLGVHTLKLVGAHQKSPHSAGYTVTLGWLRILL